VSAPAASIQPDDFDLVQSARQGNQAAFGDLMRLHHERTFRLVYAIVRHEADARDVCQEVWLTVWRQLPEFRGDAHFTTWLHPIATRRALDHLRKRRRWYERFLPFNPDEDLSISTSMASPEPDAAAALDGQDRLVAIKQALDALPAKHRAVLALRELEGLSYEKIASVMKVPAGTVMSRIYHARRLLAKKLGAKL
jgi:RNA polymerase sigma-70 factor, ECF subfamily